MMNKIKIEVAYFISTFADATGADDVKRKGKAPKEENS